jgi:NhaA family Na+:H+ antiporter
MSLRSVRSGREFVRTEAAGGVALGIAALVALAWANSPWQASYETLWHSDVEVAFGVFRFAEDLRHFVNDGLMALFFFVVGLEIKREVVHGELADRRVAALPVFAAIGGMIVPALLYAALAGGGEGGHGWGIPMATDIAFALGVLALMGARIPSALKLFLLTLAIVDDVGAIVVIAVFYSGTIDVPALAAAVTGLVLCLVLRRLRVEWAPLHVALAVAVWYATYRSGVHATIAGVALALTTPTRRHARAGGPGPGESTAEHLEALLHPTTSFVVLPVFALANVGVELRGDMLDAAGATRVAISVAIGLVVGKLAGIVAGAWIGTRLRLAVVPSAVDWRHLTGAAALGGVGFTVSLFIAGLAFTDPALVDAAKLAILAASVAAAAVGAAFLLRREGRG